MGIPEGREAVLRKQHSDGEHFEGYLAMQFLSAPWSYVVQKADVLVLRLKKTLVGFQQWMPELLSCWQSVSETREYSL